MEIENEMCMCLNNWLKGRPASHTLVFEKWTQLRAFLNCCTYVVGIWQNTRHLFLIEFFTKFFELMLCKLFQPAIWWKIIFPCLRLRISRKSDCCCQFWHLICELFTSFSCNISTAISFPNHIQKQLMMTNLRPILISIKYQNREICVKSKFFQIPNTLDPWTELSRLHSHF